MAVLTAKSPLISGSANLADHSVTHRPNHTWQQTAYCLQFNAHFANITGREHVELYATIKIIPRQAVQETATGKVTEVGPDKEDRDLLRLQYSGGIRRKLSVACTLIGVPQIIFLDGPSTGMDPIARWDLWRDISNMVAWGGSKTGIQGCVSFSQRTPWRSAKRCVPELRSLS